MDQVTNQRSPGGARDWHEPLGRAGFAAKGTLYLIIGVIAIAVALGAESQTADQTGALRSLADEAAGNALLVALAVGLGAYALFRLIEAIVGPQNSSGAEARIERVASVVRFFVYGSLCVAAVRLLADAGTSKGNESQTTSTAFDLPAGVFLVFAAGLVLIGVGAYQGYESLSSSYEDELDTARMGGRTRTAVRYLGATGHAARAVVFPLIGAFLIKAAVEHDSSEAIGIDGALRELSQQALGPALLLVVALGLVLYGAFTIAEARYRKL